MLKAASSPAAKAKRAARPRSTFLFLLPRQLPSLSTMSGKPMPTRRNVFEWQATGRSVCGAAHRRSGLPLQDAIRWLPGCGVGANVALAVADGHGSPPSFRSDTGAALAVETATAVMEDFRQLHSRVRLQDITRLRSIATEQIPRELVGRWRVAVRHHLDENPFSPPALEQVEAAAGSSARGDVSLCV